MVVSNGMSSRVVLITDEFISFSPWPKKNFYVVKIPFTVEVTFLLK